MHGTIPLKNYRCGLDAMPADRQSNLSDHGSEIERNHLRDAFARFATGVTIVTAGDQNGTIAGLTANSFASVSLDPPLLLVCIRASSYSLDVIRELGCFAVHVLAEDDATLARTFARSDGDKFAGLDVTFSRRGTPRLPNYLARFECDLHQEHDGGDHRIVLGRILEAEQMERSGDPLIFYRSRLIANTQE